MLGRDIWSKSDNSPVHDLSSGAKSRRFSSGDLVLSHDEKGVVTYYQVIKFIIFQIISKQFLVNVIFVDIFINPLGKVALE